MSTLAKPKKPARKPAARRPAAPRARLTPPPGLSAAEFLKNLPPPIANFDAEGVARIVACRSDR